MRNSDRSGLRSGRLLGNISFLIFLGMIVSVASGAQDASRQKPPSPPANAEVMPRGQRTSSDIVYGDWRKLCFKAAGAKTLCRTSITGKFETGQMAVRVDLIEREGDNSARLQLFLPVGMYLPAGVKLTVDKGRPYPIPYTWCLTNACIAANVAAPKLIKEMESGQTLLLESVDSNMLSVATSLPLGRFASVRKGAPEKTLEQDIEE